MTQKYIKTVITEIVSHESLLKGIYKERSQWNCKKRNFFEVHCVIYVINNNTVITLYYIKNTSENHVIDNLLKDLSFKLYNS